MHIVVADDLAPGALELLRSVPGWTVDARTGRSPGDLAAALADADALIVRSATRVDAALIAAAPRLRVIARAGTGVDNVDVEAASARGILVLNAPGANSVSVAEHTFALMLACARHLPRADALVKAGRWEKRSLVGLELRGKTLGIVGLGRVGQEVAARAIAFGMSVVAHDPFISEQVAAALGVELADLDEVCGRADFLTLHLPATPATRKLVDAARLARCKPGVVIVNTARGELVDEEALRAAIESGRVAAAGLDVFDPEPPADTRLVGLPQVVATPHVAASTREAQELVGLETATSVIEFLRDGVVRNAVNFPSLSAEEFRRLQPFIRLAERLGALVGQLAEGRRQAVGVRYYGALTNGPTDVLASAVLAGVLRPILSEPVTLVNARSVAAARGLELIESRSSRPRDFTNLISVKLHTTRGEQWAEGTVFEPGRPRLVSLDGVPIEAPLEGTAIVIRNEDQPGVIGEVGMTLARHGVNIATFALGRGPDGAVGVVNIDERADGLPVTEQALEQIRRIPAVRRAHVVRFWELTPVRVAG
jgi:D-3-phosphoglycerate dehydrogenase